MKSKKKILYLILYITVGIFGYFTYFYTHNVFALRLDKIPLVSISKEMLDHKIHVPKHKDKCLIYTCMKYPCGGWADRRKGIIGAFLLSLLSNRTFGIIHTHPVAITDYWLPKSIGWNIPMSEFEGKSNMTLNSIDDSSFVKTLSNVSFPSIFKADIVYYKGNLDIIDELRRHPNVKVACPWLGAMADCDVYANLWNVLFQPTKNLTQEVDSFFTNQVGTNKLACAHIRLGKNPSMPEDDGDTDYKTFFKLKNILNMWNFMNVSIPSNYKVFVASDSGTVKEKAKQRFKTRLIDTEGKITYVDRTTERIESGFKKTMSEFSILSRCDFLVLTLSGFGIHAAYHRNTSDYLYCMYRDKVG